MSFYVGAESFGCVPDHTLYLRRRVRDEADAATTVHSRAAVLILVASATACAERLCNASDQAWIAANRLW